MKEITHETPLRRVRRESGQTLKSVADSVDYDVGNLSRVERNLQKAPADLAERLSRHFEGRISELQILYPDRYMPPVSDSSTNSLAEGARAQ
ncbi:hypothetical protein CAI21_21615 [Alkalilimnicola ehrlichii]|uniref:HTH cro/C1-type domain-containing protein n=1 Tax=Alkalilimnicola ehrlichii TaxID=351052 RepID=A0A3E0WSJ4_9GAMM|nr:hypothetical protein CAI21_21615 [Alkalilimnicola ehrlichii]RFA35163.1 hypothetical protein CAL65_13750 [Alkalilimnicola ehrlichii]